MGVINIKKEPNADQDYIPKVKKKKKKVLKEQLESVEKEGEQENKINKTLAHDELSVCQKERDRRSPSNDSDFSGFESCSANEDLKKRQKLEKVKSQSQENRFELFLRVKSKSMKKEKTKLTDDEIYKFLQGMWSNMSEYKRRKFTDRHLDSHDESDERGKTSYDDDISDCSSISGSTVSQTKKSAKKSIDGDDTAKGTYRLPRNEKVCYKCELVSRESNGADMVRCKGQCCGYFHYSCLGFEKKPVADKEYKCPDCVSGRHPCFICKSYEGVAKLIENAKPSEKRGRKPKANNNNCSVSNTQSNSVYNSECNSSFSETKGSKVKSESKSIRCRISESMRARNNSDNNDADKKSSDNSVQNEVISSSAEKTTSKDHEEDESSVKNESKMEENKSTFDKAEETLETQSSNGDEPKEKCESADTKQIVNNEVPAEIIRCTVANCGKFYHLECVLKWPQVSHVWREGKVSSIIACKLKSNSLRGVSMYLGYNRKIIFVKMILKMIF